MNRLASALIVGGAALLLLWQVTPATSAPPPRSAAAIALDQAAPVMAQVNAQVDRLRERLEAPPPFPPPSRDPFNFGSRPDRTPRPAPVDAPAIVEAPPAPALPVIVAILSNPGEHGDLRTAVFSIDDDVQIVASGQTIGPFVIRTISADRVVLVDRASNAVFSIKLN